MQERAKNGKNHVAQAGVIIGMEFLEVDGSFGEGGGQILRTALSFSIIQGRPVHITRIRAGREMPGLRPQHAAVLRILRDISGGTLTGGHVGSSEIFFTPDRVESRTITVDLGTAASITLVLQAVVPAVALSGASLELNLTGGTDVPWSPTTDYFHEIVMPAMSALGIQVELSVLRRGYYPKGGGKVRAIIQPASSVHHINIEEKRSSPPAQIRSRCGRLPRNVAERQASSARSRLSHAGIEVAKVDASVGESSSPGSSILVFARDSSCFIGSDSIGGRGRPAEQVGEHAALEFMRTYRSGSVVDLHLADMLAPLLCLAGAESRLLIARETGHLKTSLYLAELFTGAKSSLSRQGDSLLLSVLPVQ